MTQNNSDIHFAFFGTPDIAVTALGELEEADLTPSLIVTAPDKPKGRGLLLTPPPVKAWAEARSIPVLQPATLKNNDELLSILRSTKYDLFVVVAYGKIIPKIILDIPKHGSLNLHLSLLPKYRGPSPVAANILADDRDMGATVMLLDEEMDHGDIVARCEVRGAGWEHGWPVRASEAYAKLSRMGGELLAEAIPKWVRGEITAVPQDHSQARYSKKITKEDALIILTDDPYQNYLKFCAYDVWPRAYFIAERGGRKIRVIITDAEFKDNIFSIKKVIPEGKKEMPYRTFAATL